MPPPHPGIFPLEIIYSLIIIILCAIIATKTLKNYKLTGHQGLKLFGQTFVYFGLAYLLRPVPALFQFTDISPHSKIPFLVGLFLFATFSTLAIITLVRSTLKTKGIWVTKTPYIILSLLIACTLLFRSFILFTLLQLSIIIAGVIINLKGKHTWATINYNLLSLFWLLTIAIVTIRAIPPALHLTLYTMSIALFTLITIRVLRT